MVKKWTIYKITNPNGRVYVGRTVDFKKRIYNYSWRCSEAQRLIYRSIKKYGFDSHEVRILDEFEGDLNMADSKEIFWIRSYMSHIHKFPGQKGMNLTAGGGGQLGRVVAKSTRKKLSDYNKANPSRGCLGHKMTEESKLKMSLRKIGKPPPNKGKPMPIHQLELLRKANTGRTPWNKGKDYDYLNEDERKEKFGKHNIGHIRNRGRVMKPEFVEANRQRKLGKENPKKWKAVIWLDLQGNVLKEFPSVKSAAADLNVCLSTIVSWCNGKHKGSVNQKWNFKYK